MKRFTKSKKVLFGLSLSLVLAMAIGSFALGEAQTPVTPQVAASNAGTGDFVVTGDADGYSFDSGSGVLTISGGTHTISMEEDVDTTTQRIYVDGPATIILDWVSINATDGPALQIEDNADFDVNIQLTYDAYLQTTANDCAGLQKNGGSGALTIEEVLEDSSRYVTLRATGGDNAAGIGGGNGENGSNIDITGDVYIEATGGTNGAGIGGGNGGNGSDISINTTRPVEANAGSGGAGIGGGNDGSGSNIYINTDARVTANAETGGAGIGGGNGGNGNNIYINIGRNTFTVNGGSDAAGIGGGNGGNGTEITIENGSIEVTGGSNGAGIGGGNGGNGSEITINNASVTATGGSGGAGIGGGRRGTGSGITITDGSIMATGGNGAAGIGSGENALAGSNNSLNNGVVTAACGRSTAEEALDGFSCEDGIIFVGKVTDYSDPINIDWKAGEMRGNVTISQSVTFPADLTVEENETLGINNPVSVPDNATLYNKGTINLLSSYYLRGNAKTYVAFYDANGEKLADGYQTYKADYTDFPDTSGIENFDGWYTKPDKQGGYLVDDNIGVLINEHGIYVHIKGIPFAVEGGDADTDYSISANDKTLKILSDKEMVIKHAEGYSGTDWRIVIDENVDGANLVLSGINITTTYGAAFEIPNNAGFDVKVTLADGTTNILDSSLAYYYAALQKSNDSDIDIDELGTLTIGGNGELIATGGEYGAGIGGSRLYNPDTQEYYGENGSKIKIISGKVTATGDKGAGIGGGRHGTGSYITIDGGIVTATSGDGAGIGGGYQRNGSYITINGGEVVAEGAAAGIGGADASYITINGGVVTATGMPYGAGIGAGGERITGNASYITITGGKVIATGGGLGAAGIGGGIGGTGSYIKITGGEVEAYGAGGAGIGGGAMGNGNNIEITGGVVKAAGGIVNAGGMYYGAGIGGGGSASNNKLDGDAVVLAISADSTKEALEGFDSESQGSINQGIVFTGIGEYEQYLYMGFMPTYRLIGVNWDESGEMYKDSVKITEDAEFPANLTIKSGNEVTVEENATLTIPDGVTLAAEDGATLTVSSGGTLKNDGTIPEGDNVVVSGTIITKTDFYLEGSTDIYQTGYQTYKTSDGVQKYANLPNPDKNSIFEGWYTEIYGKLTKITEKSNVLPNNHRFYENRAEGYSIEVGDLENGQIKLDESEALEGSEVSFEVIPDDGYRLQEGSLKVTVNGKEVEVVEDGGKYTFVMPNGDVSITAIFEQIPEPTPTPPGPEPTPTPEPTPDPSVDPDGGDGSGSGASSKTSDPFMGGAALLLLGVATTGAVLTRKFK